MAWRVELSSLAREGAPRTGPLARPAPRGGSSRPAQPDLLENLADLDPQHARRILTFLHERVARLDDPRSIGEALRGSRLGVFWKYRVGDWRIIAHIDDGALRILVVRIGSRSEVYRR